MTGIDPAEPFRGYTTREEAEEIIAEYGSVEELAAAVCERHGFVEVNPRKAQRGDVAIFDNGGNPALGVCVGSIVAIAGRGGLLMHSLTGCRRAWRVI